MTNTGMVMDARNSSISGRRITVLITMTGNYMYLYVSYFLREDEIKSRNFLGLSKNWPKMAEAFPAHPQAGATLPSPVDFDAKSQGPIPAEDQYSHRFADWEYFGGQSLCGSSTNLPGVIQEPDHSSGILECTASPSDSPSILDMILKEVTFPSQEGKVLSFSPHLILTSLTDILP
jgi:hypothetical protein